MRYQDYTKKMKKLRTFRNGMFHMRYVFLGVTLAGIAAGVSVMACTGVVSEVQKAKSTYVYGEKIDLQGSAFLSDVVYQYRKRGTEEWSEVQPQDAGNYEYRYYTKNTFGTNKYSEPVGFEIARKPEHINVISDRVVYGEEPDVELPLLDNGDKISGYELIYGDFSTMSTTVRVDPATVQVVSPDGKDNTANYEFFSEDKDLAFEKRFISFHFGGGEFVYDNATHTNEDVMTSDNNLAFNDSVVVGGGVLVKDVGKVKNLREIKIVNDKKQDVTHLYNINETADYLVVNPRKIEVTSQDITREYNGKIVEQKWGYTGDTTVAPGHELEVKFDNPDAWEVGEKKSTFKCHVIDSVTRKPVKEGLYDITTNFGTVTIKPRNLQVATENVFSYYTGASISDERLYTSGLADGDVAVVEPGSTQSTDKIGVVKNSLKYNIMRGDINVTHCYKINESFGELEIAKRPITVKLDVKPSKVYDGKPTIVSSDNFEVLTNDQDSTSQGLAPNHVAVPNVDFEETFTDVGVYDFKQFSISIFEKDPETGRLGIENQIDKYDVTYQGTTSIFEIEPVHISVKTPDIKQTYDGELISDHNIEITDGGLLPGDTFKVVQDQDYRDATDKPQNNVLAISIVDANGKDVTKNYVFDNTVYGEVSIDKKEVIVSPKDYTKNYDDRAYNESGAELNITDKEGRDLSNKYKAYGNVKSSQIDATEEGQTADITMVDNKVIIKDAQNNDVTSNFLVQCAPTPGKLTINKIGVEIKVNGGEIAYEQNPNLILNDEDATFTGLLSTHEAKNVVYSGTLPEPSADPTPITVESFDVISSTRGGINVRDNYYVIDNIGGTYNTFYQSEVVISSSDVIRTYDGTAIKLSDAERALTAKGLAKGHKVVADEFVLDDPYKSYVNVRDTVNLDYNNEVLDSKVDNICSYHIVDANGKDVTSCYRSITEKYGEVKIMPRDINVNCRNKVFIYNENSFSYDVANTNEKGYKVEKNYRNPVYIYNGKGLAENEELYMNGFGVTGTTPGTYDPFEHATFTVYKTTGERVDDANYKITSYYDSGKLTIKKIDIALKTMSYKGEFDTSVGYGMPQFENSYSYSGKLLPNHHLEVTLKQFTSRTTMTEENIATYRIVNMYGEDVTQFYNVQTDWGQVYIF